MLNPIFKRTNTAQATDLAYLDYENPAPLLELSLTKHYRSTLLESEEPDFERDTTS